MPKAFSELSERDILALAISLDEDDARIYGDYAERLKADYPDTAKMLKIMQTEEFVHAQRLTDTFRAQFGEHIPFIERQEVKGFLRRKPLWLAKVLSVQQVRKEVELMELESMRFYQTAVRRTVNQSVRKLLDELAVAEQVHEDRAGKLKRELDESGARKTEDQTHRRMFVL
jgi:rubrerythrin